MAPFLSYSELSLVCSRGRKQLTNPASDWFASVASSRNQPSRSSRPSPRPGGEPPFSPTTPTSPRQAPGGRWAVRSGSRLPACGGRGGRGMPESRPRTHPLAGTGHARAPPPPRPPLPEDLRTQPAAVPVLSQGTGTALSVIPASSRETQDPKAHRTRRLVSLGASWRRHVIADLWPHDPCGAASAIDIS